ncbi:MAG: hypothetical protein U0271_22690 [Polyangiaceae bacterium]
MQTFLFSLQGSGTIVLLCALGVSSSACGARCPSDAASSANSARADGPMERLQRARRAAAMGRLEEAWEHYQWCLDHGLDADRSFEGVWATELPPEIEELGRKYPPALAALRDRSAALEQEIVKAQPWPNDRAARLSAEATQYASVNATLGQSERTVQVYRDLAQKGAATIDVRKALWIIVVGYLYEERRYGDIVREHDVGDAQLALARKTASTNGSIADIDYRVYVRLSAMYFEAFLGANQDAAAMDIAEGLIALKPSGQAFAALIASAIRAGAPDIAKRLHTRAGQLVPNEERALVDDAAAKIDE